MNLSRINEWLATKSPEEIIEWGLGIAHRPILTTNFRPLSQVLLHAVVEQDKSIPVIWVDSGYNTSYTYRHAVKTIEKLDLNMDIFTPKQTPGFRDVIMGIPQPDTTAHREFTEQVKLEPFRRAIESHDPDVWFTNLRKGQTAFRDGLNIVSQTKDGIIKICPFFYWTDEEMIAYIKKHDLESEERYYDPTKVHENRECGLHT